MTSKDEVELVYDHFSSAILYMAMTDYPTPSNFLENMPANPVKHACDKIADVPLKPTEEELKAPATGGMSERAKTVLGALKTLTNVYFNYEVDPPKC